MNCRYWLESCYCNAPDARAYLPGPRCPDHTPAVVAGRTDHEPDPALTLNALRAAAGLTYGYRPSDSSLINDRAVASGRRRSNRQTYLAAQAAEDARRKTEKDRRKTA